MADEPNVAPAASEPASAPSLPPDTGRVSVDQAASAISKWRAEQAQPSDKPTSEQPRVNGKFAKVEGANESPLEGVDAAADEQPPGETEQGDDPAELPSIDPPRSWTKEDKEAFKLLPPERQQSIVDTERKRDADIRRGQDEVANERKAIEAERKAAEQARQQYESNAQNALQLSYQQLFDAFPELKSSEEMKKLAESDPFRAIAAREAEKAFVDKAQKFEREQQQWRQSESRKFEAWSVDEDKKFEKSNPEFADKERGQKARKIVRSYLVDTLGIPEAGLKELWSNPLFRDSKTQQMAYDAARFNKGKQDVKNAVAVPKPAVQRPGTAPQKGGDLQEKVNAAFARLSNAKGSQSAEAAAELMRLRRTARR